MSENIIPKENDPESIAKLRALMNKVDQNNPTPEDIAALKEFFSNEPNLLKQVGDLSSLAISTLIDTLEVNNSTEVIVRTYQQQLCYELGYKQASRLEQLLIDQVILTGIWCNYLQNNLSSSAQKQMDDKPLRILDKHLSSAQRRYLRSCEVLARVRKIIRTTPALQVNIAMDGSQQINMVNISNSESPTKE
jgi:hypothetical protein